MTHRRSSDTFGLYKAQRLEPDAVAAMSETMLTWWSYFFFYRNGRLGVQIQNQDAPFLWDGSKWISGRNQWFDDFEQEIP